VAQTLAKSRLFACNQDRILLLRCVELYIKQVPPIRMAIQNNAFHFYNATLYLAGATILEQMNETLGANESLRNSNNNCRPFHVLTSSYCTFLSI
jgi:hypothetical protein